MTDSIDNLREAAEQDPTLSPRARALLLSLIDVFKDTPEDEQ